jgi:hypothetical protein
MPLRKHQISLSLVRNRYLPIKITIDHDPQSALEKRTSDYIPTKHFYKGTSKRQ